MKIVKHGQMILTESSDPCITGFKFTHDAPCDYGIKSGPIDTRAVRPMSQNERNAMGSAYHCALLWARDKIDQIIKDGETKGDGILMTHCSVSIEVEKPRCVRTT